MSQNIAKQTKPGKVINLPLPKPEPEPEQPLQGVLALDGVQVDTLIGAAAARLSEVSREQPENATVGLCCRILESVGVILMRSEGGGAIPDAPLRAATRALLDAVGERTVEEEEAFAMITPVQKHMDLDARAVYLLETADRAHGDACEGKYDSAAQMLHAGVVLSLGKMLAPYPFVPTLAAYLRDTRASRDFTAENIARKALREAGLSRDDAKHMVNVGGGAHRPRR